MLWNSSEQLELEFQCGDEERPKSSESVMETSELEGASIEKRVFLKYKNCLVCQYLNSILNSPCVRTHDSIFFSYLLQHILSSSSSPNYYPALLCNSSFSWMNRSSISDLLLQSQASPTGSRSREIDKWDARRSIAVQSKKDKKKNKVDWRSSHHISSAIVYLTVMSRAERSAESDCIIFTVHKLDSHLSSSRVKAPRELSSKIIYSFTPRERAAFVFIAERVRKRLKIDAFTRELTMSGDDAMD